MDEAQSENTRLLAELRDVEGVAEGWADVAHHNEDLADALRTERDEAIAHNSQLQQQLNEVQAELREVEGVADRNEDLADAMRAERDQAQRERDEVQTQNTQLQAQIAQLQEELAQTRREHLEAGAPGAGLDLGEVRDRILSKVRSDKLNAVKAALDKFIKALQ